MSPAIKSAPKPKGNMSLKRLRKKQKANNNLQNHPRSNRRLNNRRPVLRARRRKDPAVGKAAIHHHQGRVRRDRKVVQPVALVVVRGDERDLAAQLLLLVGLLPVVAGAELAVVRAVVLGAADPFPLSKPDRKLGRT